MLAAPVVFFNVANLYQTAALAGLEGYAGIAKAGVIAGCAYFLLCVGGAVAGGREGVLAALSASAGVQWLALRFFLGRERSRQGIRVDYRGIREEREIVVKFAMPAALSGFSSMPALWLSSAFLVRQPGGYAQMALYAAATNLRVLVLLLPQLLNNVGMSLLNCAKGLGDIEQYRKVFWGNLGLTAAVTSVGALIISIVGPSALAVFGHDFRDGYPVLLVLMASTLIESLMQASYQIIQSHARMWLSLFAIALPRDATIVVLAYFLTIYGAKGLALAYTAGWGLALVCTVILAGSLLHRTENRETSIPVPLHVG
jgi:O-antigen/teichoic acid export membrane protein